MCFHILPQLVKRLRRRRCFFGRLGNNCVIGKPCVLYNEKYMFFSDNVRIGNYASLSCYDTYGGGQILYPRLTIGTNFLAGEYLKILCAGNIQIGNDVTLAGNIFITNENHGLNPITNNYLDNLLDVEDVIIEDGVWIGEKTIILPGVRIGRKSIIAAGSVVNRSIPEYSIAAGNPCKVKKVWNGEEWLKV